MKKLMITTISPVHIGTGEELGNWDFIQPPREDKVYFVDFNKINIDSKVLTEAIEGEERGLWAVLKEKNIHAKDVSKYILKKDSSVNILRGVREQIKSVNNCPYIPGTEIKGAIRTAILWWVVKNSHNDLTTRVVDCLKETLNSVKDEIKNASDKNKVRSKWETTIDNKIEEIVFGDDPQKDILKALYIGDTDPFGTNEMEVVETKVMTVNGAKAYWKDFRNRKNSPDSTAGTPTFIEGIMVGKKTVSNVRIEDFFWKEDKQNELKFDSKKEYLLKIIAICKEYSKDIWNMEMKFYRDLEGAGVKELVAFYDDRKITDLKENEFFLPIGWGTGQGAKTIFHLLPPKLQDDLRWALKLGKFDRSDNKKIMINPYSKTRKIAFESGKARYPLGWIKVEAV